MEVFSNQNEQLTPTRAEHGHVIKDKLDYFKKLMPLLPRLRIVSQPTEIAKVALILLFLTSVVSSEKFIGPENQQQSKDGLMTNVTRDIEELKDSISTDYQQIRRDLEKILEEVHLLRALYKQVVTQRCKYDEEVEDKKGTGRPRKTLKAQAQALVSRKPERKAKYDEPEEEEQPPIDDFLDDDFEVDESQAMDDENDQIVGEDRIDQHRASSVNRKAQKEAEIAQQRERERERALQLEIEKFEKELRLAEEKRQLRNEDDRRPKEARKPAAARKRRGNISKKPWSLGYILLRTVLVCLTSCGTLMGICVAADKFVKELPLAQSVMYAAVIPLFCFMLLLAVTAFNGTALSVNIAIALVVLVATFIVPRIFKQESRSNVYLVLFILASCAGSIFQVTSTVLSVWDL